MLYLEIIAVISSLISVIYAVKGNIYTWISGIIGVIAYGILFYINGLYWNMALQVIFLIQSMIGLYKWKLDIIDNTLGKTTTNTNVLILFSVIIMLMFPANIIIDNAVIMTDIQASIFSVIALYYLINKKITTWFYWILANICLVSLFIHTEMYMSAILYLFFIVLNIIAMYKWKKDGTYGIV